MMEFIRVLEVRVVPPYSLWLRFSDGAQGTVDLTTRLHGQVFGPLLEPAAFAQVTLDENAYTVCWPNGADLAPEYLRDQLVTSSSGRVAERPSP
jgi:hypothetical protein